MDTKSRPERLEAIRDELFEIANSYAGDKTGNVAVELHSASHRITNAMRMLTDGITLDDKVKQAEEWCNNQKFPMSPAQRHMVTSLLAR